MGEMNDIDRMLAEAWRDLAGWHVGMVTLLKNVVWSVEPDGWVHLSNTANVAGSTLVPALDSPANWGHWLAWCWKEFGLGSVPVPPIDSTLPSRLLRGLVESKHPISPDTVPSVLAWWKAEQEGEAE